MALNLRTVQAVIGRVYRRARNCWRQAWQFWLRALVGLSKRAALKSQTTQLTYAQGYHFASTAIKEIPQPWVLVLRARPRPVQSSKS